jgi:prepilin-type N-terminal cleavage/methylation domain-containing protein
VTAKLKTEIPVQIAARQSPAKPRAGLTLFELLAVLTVIGIGLMLLVGAYGSWGTAHALSGATRTLEAGLAHARTLALTQGAYVAFSYGTTNPPNTTLSATTGFQPFFCTNTVPPVSEADLKTLVQNLDNTTFIPADGALFNSILVVEPAAPFQRLSRHVRLSRRETSTGTSPVHTPSVLIFRPDGSVMMDDSITTDNHYHYIAVETTESFPVINSTETAPLLRLVRIDLFSGLITVLGGAP